MEENRTDSGGMEVNFRVLFHRLLSRLPLILLVAVCGAVLLYAYARSRASSSYTSTASLYVLAKEEGEAGTRIPYWLGHMENDLDAGNLLTVDGMEIVKSDTVLQDVITELGLKDVTPESLSKKIEVTHTSDTRIIHIAVTDDDPIQARQIAEAVVNASASRIAGLTGCADVRVMDEASTPVEETVTSVRKKALLGGIAGAAAAIFVILLRFLSDDTLHCGEDIEKYLAVPSFGQVPLASARKENQNKHLRRKEKEARLQREAIRSIRANLRLGNPEARVVACAAATHGEGTTVIARCLAEALAASGQKTLLIDTDLCGRHPASGTGKPDAASAAGLSDVLLKRCSAAQAVLPSDREGLFVMRAGSDAEQGSERMESAAYRTLIDAMRAQYDYVILDVRALKDGMDGLTAASVSDGVVIVVEAGAVSARTVKHVMEKITRTGVRVLGGVLNKAED